MSESPDTRVAPGDTCDNCGRRVPHPKKPSSPTSKVTAYRTPLDLAESHDEIAVELAKELGVYEKPFWRWALNSYAYAVLLQGARLEEAGG